MVPTADICDLVCVGEGNRALLLTDREFEAFVEIFPVAEIVETEKGKLQGGDLGKIPERIFYDCFQTLVFAAGHGHAFQMPIHNHWFTQESPGP